MAAPYDPELKQRLLGAARDYLEHADSAGFVLPLGNGDVVAVGRPDALTGMLRGQDEKVKAKPWQCPFCGYVHGGWGAGFCRCHECGAHLWSNGSGPLVPAGGAGGATLKYPPGVGGGG